MARIKIISENKLRYIAGKRGFNLIYLEKDYFLTLFLYLIKDVGNVCFKGGTAINKTILKHNRLSEDLDFVCQSDLESVKKIITRIIKENKDIFPKYNFENQISDFFRLKGSYNSFFSGTDSIIVDMNAKASVLLKPKKHDIYHFYDDIPKFQILILNPKEIVAEKIRALIARNQPRDYFDVYHLIQEGYKIDLNLVKKKLEEANEEYTVERIFKNAKKIYSRWETEINQLTNKPVKFMTVIKKLQKEFKYKNN
jgi:predicted nucleotidyltransferase component of viral defense system